jgi:hypothetical protein
LVIHQFIERFYLSNRIYYMTINRLIKQAEQFCLLSEHSLEKK